MVELDQFQIIQEILKLVIASAGIGWQELIVNYHVDDVQSSAVISYLVDKGGKKEEVGIGYVRGLDEWMIKLREHLGQDGKVKFSQCKIHVTAAGKYETTYAYDPVDWDALLIPESNFFPKAKAKASNQK